MAASMRDPRTMFSAGSPAQFDYVLGLYDVALKLKAEQKNKKLDDFLKLDKWYQDELPKRIKARGKDAHLVHEELVQCMKWKLSRGKFNPRIKDLVQMNTPRICITETKKAFRALLKKDDLSSAIQALCNLKGVGPAMASVMLTAADHTQCCFMADEVLMAIPEMEGIDYTTKELLNCVDQLKAAANRLNNSGGSGWNAHKVEQAVWTHFVLNETKKELLDDMPASAIPDDGDTTEGAATENGTGDASSEAAAEAGQGSCENSSDSADSLSTKEKVLTTSNSNGTSGPPRQISDVISPQEEDTNDSNTNDSNTDSSNPSTINANTTSSAAAAVRPAPLVQQEENTNDSIPSSSSSTSGGSTESPVPPPEEDSVNTASPPQLISEDANDATPAQGQQQQQKQKQSGQAVITNSSNGRTAMDDDTNDSVAVSSESACDSVPEVISSTDKVLAKTTLVVTPPGEETLEPATKKAKIYE